MDRQARNATAITAWRDEENWQIEDERRIFKESTPGDADKRLKSKLFLSLGKQKKRYINKKHPFRKIVDMRFLWLWKLSTDTFQKETKIFNKRFIFFERNQMSIRARSSSLGR